jgi:hypothetical protein
MQWLCSVLDTRNVVKEVWIVKSYNEITARAELKAIKERDNIGFISDNITVEPLEFDKQFCQVY